MLYKDKTKWNTLLASEESTAVAKILGVSEAKILRLGHDDSDADELDRMDFIFLKSTVNETYVEDFEILKCVHQEKTFLCVTNGGGELRSYYIVNEEGTPAETWMRNEEIVHGKIQNDPHLLDIELGRLDRRIDELTLDELKEMKPGVFAYGEVENSEEGIYMSSSNIGKKLFWVAKRGGFYDWAIYTHWAENGFAFCLSSGDKVSKYNARKLVKCTDEALNMYRQ